MYTHGSRTGGWSLPLCAVLEQGGKRIENQASRRSDNAKRNDHESARVATDRWDIPAVAGDDGGNLWNTDRRGRGAHTAAQHRPLFVVAVPPGFQRRQPVPAVSSTAYVLAASQSPLSGCVVCVVAHLAFTGPGRPGAVVSPSVCRQADHRGSGGRRIGLCIYLCHDPHFLRCSAPMAGAPWLAKAAYLRLLVPVADLSAKLSAAGAEGSILYSVCDTVAGGAGFAPGASQAASKRGGVDTVLTPRMKAFIRIKGQLGHCGRSKRCAEVWARSECVVSKVFPPAFWQGWRSAFPGPPRTHPCALDQRPPWRWTSRKSGAPPLPRAGKQQLLLSSPSVDAIATVARKGAWYALFFLMMLRL